MATDDALILLLAELDGLAGSSLGSKAPNNHNSLLPCPGRPLVLALDTEELELFSLPCKRLSCDSCLVRNAKRRQAAIMITPIERMVVFTQVAPERDPKPCATAVIRMSRARQALQRKGIHCGEWTWTIEHNPNMNGYHAHALQHGPFVPQDLLQVACLKAGMGFPYIARIRADKRRAIGYNLKGFGPAAYSLKTFRSIATARKALNINNGRLEHHTRGFYNIDGKVRSVKDAEALACTKRVGESDKNLVVGSPGELLQFLRLHGDRLI